ncbi:cytochrome P450 [Actinomycetospora aeridis]|uniref:Cytochrome P450 n=1 Tax=Actinomycetospora aeridis TaxID=3129231 RepID=A0ABU8N0R2_9PSEU
MTAPAAPAAPGPPLAATPVLLRELFTDRLALLTRARGYGPLARLRIGPKTMFVVNHPDAAAHVLTTHAGNYTKGIGLAEARRVLGDGVLTSDGPAWKEQRRAVAPSFTPARLAEQIPVVADEAGALVERLGARVEDGPVDVTAEMTALTLGVLGRTLVGADLTAYPDLGHAFETVQDQAMLEAVTLGASVSWRPTPGGHRFRAAQRRLVAVVDAILDTGRGELVARLGAGVDRATLRGRLVTLLLAGHETTAATLSWALHRLSRHPEVRRRVRAEAREVLGDRPGDVDDLARLSYTAQVVSETVRLHPPVWLLPRVAVDDDVVAGYRVPAGSDVVVCPYTLHRDPAWWDEPEVFDPERFAPGATWPKEAYLPFGAGRHFCVGSNLGTAEAVLVLARLCRDLDLRAVAGSSSSGRAPLRSVSREPRGEPMLSLRVRGGLPLTVHKPS